MDQDPIIPRTPRSGIDRRVEERREQCAWHEGRDRTIDEINASTSRHSGQWLVLMWAVGIMSGLVVLIGSMVWTTAQHTNDVVVAMDKTFTSYMVAHMQESEDGFRRIEGNEQAIKNNATILMDHDQRLRRIEIGKGL
jgi:hypothetical protein